jgi:hypothetical protein
MCDTPYYVIVKAPFEALSFRYVTIFSIFRFFKSLAVNWSELHDLSGTAGTPTLRIVASGPVDPIVTGH